MTVVCVWEVANSLSTTTTITMGEERDGNESVYRSIGCTALNSISMTRCMSHDRIDVTPEL